MTLTRRITNLIGLFAMAAFTFLPLGTWGKRLTVFGPLWGSEVVFWTVTVALVIFILAVERRPLSSIGLRMPRPSDLGLAILAAAVMLAGGVLIYTEIFPLLHLQLNRIQANRLLELPYWFRVVLVTRAAVAEEIIFRGYGIERLQELTGSRWIAGALTLAAFTYAHLAGWGVAQLLIGGYAGLVLTILYLWRRNLWANMLAHWLTDGVSLLLR